MKFNLTGAEINYSLFRIIKTLILFLIAGGTFLPAASQTERNESVKIGFLVQTSQHSEAVNGAKLAVSIINSKGGIKGRKAELSIKSMEGPWGTGARQSVSLIFDDEVLAVIGSVDGRNSHLVEQACTKTGVLFISCLSADPTLAQAFVPWFFNCVPNDINQAQTLATDIFTKYKYSRIAIVKDNQYDSNTALRYFEKTYAGYLRGKNATVKVYSIVDPDDRIRITRQLISGAHDCLVLFCSAENAVTVINELKLKNISIPLYSNLYLACEEGKYAGELRQSGMKIKYCFPVRSSTEYLKFREAYRKEYGYTPGLAAELAYDAVTILAFAASNTQHDRESLQKFLYGVCFEGVTGTIGFDERGNRKGPFEITQF